MERTIFQIRKYHSGRLKEFGYSLSNTWEESELLGEVVQVFDNQILRTIRQIRGLTDTSRLSDYVVVVMDTPKQYETLFREGFRLNGACYRRLSCSASQARVSTVVFCCTEILAEVQNRLNNGRDPAKKLSPSKFNAYFGLAGSATQTVSEPRFIVVKDFVNTVSFPANYVAENGPEEDDTVIQKMMEQVPMNRTDGCGLITYEKAEQWAGELGLDYVPSQFCIRQNFIKGMLCVFPILEFCQEINQGNYLVDTIYRDDRGRPVRADLRECDVILTESQFKLWDSFESLEIYIDNCRKNGLSWGISLTSPREPKHMLKLNYQFLQTLRLSHEDIEALAEPTADWLRKVSYDDPWYMLLFLLGVNNNEEKIRTFFAQDDKYWLKALAACPELKNDRYIRGKIRDLMRRKLSCACKGDIYVEGNFQVLVSDPFGFMQHVCGLPVTGLLSREESYSGYWNRKGVTEVDAMRSPLTYLSEHVLLHFVKTEETEKWYRYCRDGIILNYYGHETVNFAGADFDMDIVATTPNPIMKRGIYPGELPVVYDVPKPFQVPLTEEDLYRADTFAFGSIIGSITNKSSSAYALLPRIEETYGTDSPEYRLLKSRLQQCCKAQSAQIDKAKIGRQVKGIPKIWTSPNEENLLSNRVLLNRYPYFFRYIYPETDRKYKKYRNQADVTCRQKFLLPLEDLEKLPDKTEEQELFLENFDRYSPVLDSQSTMNRLCHYMESLRLDIAARTRADTKKEIWKLYQSSKPYDSYYRPVVEALREVMKQKSADQILDIGGGRSFAACLEAVCPDQEILTNCLVDYFYQERPASNKELLWSTYGFHMYENLKKNKSLATARFPFPDPEGSISYLGYRYSLKEVTL